MKFIPVDPSNAFLIDRFISRCGSSLETFRYFSKRPTSVIQNHVCTWVTEEDGQIEAYGHLDRDSETIWLGIAVTEPARGKGFGKNMMRQLMASAALHNVPRLRLAVDRENQIAIRLYERFGFHFLSEDERLKFFEWRNPTPSVHRPAAVNIDRLTGHAVTQSAREE